MNNYLVLKYNDKRTYLKYPHLHNLVAGKNNNQNIKRKQKNYQQFMD